MDSAVDDPILVCAACGGALTGDADEDRRATPADGELDGNMDPDR